MFALRTASGHVDSLMVTAGLTDVLRFYVGGTCVCVVSVVGARLPKMEPRTAAVMMT
jgi:hypothetical protein